MKIDNLKINKINKRNDIHKMSFSPRENQDENFKYFSIRQMNGSNDCCRRGRNIQGPQAYVFKDEIFLKSHKFNMEQLKKSIIKRGVYKYFNYENKLLSYSCLKRA